MAKSKESVIPTGFGDDIEQLTLLRDILFGPQIRRLQEQLELLRIELEKAQDVDADPADPSAIYSRLKAELVTTQGDGKKEMSDQRDHFDRAVKKQNVENAKRFKALSEQFEANAQQQQAKNHELVQVIGALLESQEAHNSALIKGLRSAQMAQTKQLKRLQEVLGVADSAESEAKEK